MINSQFEALKTSHGWDKLFEISAGWRHVEGNGLTATRTKMKNNLRCAKIARQLGERALAAQHLDQAALSRKRIRKFLQKRRTEVRAQPSLFAAADLPQSPKRRRKRVA